LNLIQIILAEGYNVSKEGNLFETRVLAEIVVFAALSAALYALTLPFLTLPWGGSVTAGCMVPIVWLSFRRGPRIGVIGGIVFGLVALVVDVIRLPYSPIVHPAQVLLDYPIPFGAIGLAGIFKSRADKSPVYPVIGVAIATLGRFVSHFVSGVLFFWMYAPEGMNAILYSALYNGSFLTIEFIIAAIIIYLLATKNLLEIYM
jgi:thiamine transporter